ncbi:MAG: peptide deformylase [Proteobacteria bacterium]|jgi:peptide deformylase|nr:peptide deformylase [Pseudomonadota bacterium]NLN61649.1 peptide deformylase [Myxococcales bacterium]
MAIRKILVYPEDVLRRKTRTVTVFDDALRTLVDDMIETMYAAPGVGLAANQVGVDLQVCVVDVSYPDGDAQLHVLINPEIVQGEGEIVWEEGCLSFPDVLVDVTRSNQILVRAVDVNGQPFELSAEGFLAVALQHEIDHLNGISLADKVGYLRRKMMLKDLKLFKESHR